MNILNRRYRRYASEIARLEAVIEQCLAPDKYWLQLVPQSELDERRQTAERRLTWIRQYCESEPANHPSEQRDPLAERADAFVELLLVLNEGVGRPVSTNARTRLFRTALRVFEDREAAK